MIDPFVLLAPVLLLAVVALLHFVGCNQVFGLKPATLAPQITYQQLAEHVETLNNNAVTTSPFDNDVTTGNLMVVWVWYHSATASVSTVTDTANNMYQRAVGPTPGAGTLAGLQQEIWYAPNIIGGLGPDFLVTATFTGSFNAEKAISAHEYSGADPANPLDVTSAATGYGDHASSGSANTTATSLIFGAAIFETYGAPDRSQFDFVRRSRLRGNVTEDAQVVAPPSGAAEFIVNDPMMPMQDWIAQMVTFK